MIHQRIFRDARDPVRDKSARGWIGSIADSKRFFSTGEIDTFLRFTAIVSRREYREWAWRESIDSRLRIPRVEEVRQETRVID